MDINTITTLISSVGFPIVCAGCLMWYAKDTTSQIIALTKQVTEALVSSTNAIDEIKTVLSKLIEK